MGSDITSKGRHGEVPSPAQCGPTRRAIARPEDVAASQRELGCPLDPGTQGVALCRELEIGSSSLALCREFFFVGAALSVHTIMYTKHNMHNSQESALAPASKSICCAFGIFLVGQLAGCK